MTTIAIPTGAIEPLSFPLYGYDGSMLTGVTDAYLAIRRQSDGKWYDFDDNEFKSGGWGSRTQVLAEADAVFAQGMYSWTWDTSLAEAASGWLDDDGYSLWVTQTPGTSAVGLPACLGELRIGHESDMSARILRFTEGATEVVSGSTGNIRHKDSEKRRDIHLGVHTSTEMIIASMYAIGKASSALPGDEPNCGIVFELDTTGLARMHDEDAEIAADYAGVVFKELLSEIDKKEVSNADVIHEVADNFLSSWEREQEMPTHWASGVYDELGFDVDGVAHALLDFTPKQLQHVLRDFRKTGKVDAGLSSVGIAQFRYMEEIDIERVLRVVALRPIQHRLIDEDDDVEDDPAAPQVFTVTAVLDHEFYPDEVVLWKNPRPVPVQFDIELGRERRVEYHGTDVGRARKAFPELERVLRSPWPYTQEN